MKCRLFSDQHFDLKKVSYISKVSMPGCCDDVKPSFEIICEGRTVFCYGETRAFLEKQRLEMINKWEKI